jgi:putative thiamine transport system permease protein
VASLGAIMMLFLWSFAGGWSWPNAWPQRWSFEMWINTSDTLILLVGQSMIIGIIASAIATTLAIFCLEAGIDRPSPRWIIILYVPLMVPQISFLFGVQLLWNWLWLDGTLVAVTLTHLLFVLPYVLLVLSDPYRALDPRIAIAARSLGASRMRTLLRVKLPLLARPVATALAIGFAVSVGQYLPTMFAGAGRIDTLTTEAVALASGADRRLAGVIAFALTALPFFALALANIAPNRLAQASR